MADISREIQALEEARKGKEVRGSMVSLAEKVNQEVEMGTSDVAAQVRIIQDTNVRVNRVAQDAEATVVRANSTIDRADEVLVDATAQATNSKDSATLSESWAAGGTGSREGEDGDNSRYYSLQSRTEAQKASDAAARAEQYAGFVVPVFTVNFITGKLDYPTTDNIVFMINSTTGQLDYALA